MGKPHDSRFKSADLQDLTSFMEGPDDPQLEALPFELPGRAPASPVAKPKSVFEQLTDVDQELRDAKTRVAALEDRRRELVKAAREEISKMTDLLAGFE